MYINFFRQDICLLTKKQQIRLSLTPLLITLLMLSGCSSLFVNVQEGSLNHMINVSPDGNTHKVESGNYFNFVLGVEDVSETKVLSTVSSEYLSHVDEILKNIDDEQNKSKKDTALEIMLFIHGGLNTLESSITRVNEQYGEILDDNVYPIFVNWRSGAFTSYKDHLFNIRDGQTKPLEAKITSPFYFLTDLLGVISKIPEAWVEQGADSVMDTLARNDEEIIDPIVLDSGIKYIHSEEHYERPTTDSLIKGGVWTLTSPAKLLTTSAAYSFGKPAWDIMVRRTRELLFRSCEFYNNTDSCADPPAARLKLQSTLELYGLENQEQLNNLQSILKLPDPKKQKQLNNLMAKDVKFKNVMDKDFKFKICKTDPDTPLCSGALSVLLKKLNKRREDCSNNGRKICNSKITLIGHSMGAIVVSELLRYFPHMKFDNIVFMAAAISSRDTLNSVVPYMQLPEHINTLFYNLSLHPHAEDTETNLWGVVPNGSLLTWIDSMYGLPENELDRTFGQWINARQAIRLLPPDVAGRFHFRIFGLNEGKEPLTHGDFNNFEYWKPDFWGTKLFEKKYKKAISKTD